MTHSPRASVIMAIHNGEQYLEQAAQSVLGQTFRDFELLLLDDGSTDGSPEIIARLVQQDRRCKAHSWPKRGAVPTRNEGIDLAQGEILFCMDCDDISRPDRFERQIAYFDAHPDCVAVGSRSLLIDAEGMAICETVNELTHDEIDHAVLSGLGAIRGMCHPSVAMRRAAVMQVGKYQDGFRCAQDIDLFLRLAELGKLANLPDVLLEYRQHYASIGYARRVEQIELAAQAVQMARKRRGLPPLPQPKTPAAETLSMSDAHRKWAWWALTAGNVATARKHALKALASRPFSIDSLRLAACVLRGY